MCVDLARALFIYICRASDSLVACLFFFSLYVMHGSAHILRYASTPAAVSSICMTSYLNTFNRVHRARMVINCK